MLGLILISILSAITANNNFHINFKSEIKIKVFSKNKNKININHMVCATKCCSMSYCSPCLLFIKGSLNIWA